MGARLCAMDADLAEWNMSVPKIGDTPEGSPRCRLRTSRISESWHGALASRQVWAIVDRQIRRLSLAYFRLAPESSRSVFVAFMNRCPNPARAAPSGVAQRSR